MDWNQIENRWAAMTRRVRADWADDRLPGHSDAKSAVFRRNGLPAAALADLQTGSAADKRPKVSAE